MVRFAVRWGKRYAGSESKVTSQEKPMQSLKLSITVSGFINIVI